MVDLVARRAIDIRGLRLTRAFLDGFRRVLAAPAVLCGLYGLTLLAAVPLALGLHDVISSHLGSSVAADTMASSVNWEWWEEFLAEGRGFERTFTPSIIGFAAVLSNLSALADNTGLQETIALAVVLYLTIWAFLIGGILDRLARQRRLGSAGFFAACGTYFFRFLRLAVFAGLAYWVLFSFVHEWLLNDLYVLLTKNFTSERLSFFLRFGLYLGFGILVLLVNLTLDYAKIRAVVEDRNSMVGALMAAIRFVWRYPKSTIGLYLLNAGLFLIVLALYAMVAPGVTSTGPSMWVAFLVGQIYVLSRLFAKLIFYASQTAYFQNKLAHAKYVASPPKVWPESPSAEALANTST
jgi:hypothetical protein